MGMAGMPVAKRMPDTRPRQRADSAHIARLPDAAEGVFVAADPELLLPGLISFTVCLANS